MRTSMKFGGEKEICPGLEYRPATDSFAVLSRWLQLATELATSKAVWEDPHEIALKLEGYIQRDHPDRAYFIEVGDMDRWVQIYQPWEAR